MANIRMDPGGMGQHSFQRLKVLNPPNSTLNGFNKESLAPGRLQGSSPKLNEENKSYLPFAEKLKHLLENGNSSEKIDKEDPYAFSELDVVNTSVNGYSSGSASNLSISKVVGNSVTSSNSHIQRGRIPVEGPVSKLTHSPASFTDVSATELPSFSNTLGRNGDAAQPLGAHIIKNSLQELPATGPVKLSGNFKLSPSPSDRIGKNSIIMGYPCSGRLPAGGGKPINFGKSQMSKLAIAKIEKSMETKQKHCSKTRNSHSPQKYATISKKLLRKPNRPSPIRSVSLDSDLATVRNKTCSKKSLLEESLLAVKQAEWTGKRIACNANVSTSPPPMQTATTTVPLFPRFIPKAINHKALQETWNLRNQMKLLRRNYQSFGMLMDDPQDNNHTSCEGHVIQNYWFSLCSDHSTTSGLRRNAKLAQLKTELRHKLQQQQWQYRDDYRDEMAKLLIQTAWHKPNLTAFLLGFETSNRFKNRIDLGQSGGHQLCEFQEKNVSTCKMLALPFLGFCKAHFDRNRNQVLFTICSAESPLPCTAPALGKLTDQAFCVSHQRLQLNFQKPKKISADKLDDKLVSNGKRNRSSHHSNRTGRTRKRKRQVSKEKTDLLTLSKDSDVSLVSEENRVLSMAPNTLVLSKSDVDESQDVEVGEDLPLDSSELASLATQASRLLEEHDFTNVLNHIPADAFNDLFTGDKEEYEPTLQETEELERALEAVDNDVKSLEKLTQNHAILEMLDEQTLAQTLAALPEVVPVLYQNGFGGLGPLEQTLCGLHPDISALPIQPQTDVLQS